MDLLTKKVLFFILFLHFSWLAGAQIKPAFLSEYNHIWVDSVFRNMTLEQKIGQLLMPRGNFSGKPHDIEQLKLWVSKYKIGGLVFFAGNPSTQVDVTNLLQSLSDIPLFIGQDFEWGLAMRLDSTVRFPYALSMGAVQGDYSLIEKMGEQTGKHCARMGVHINYAPVADINNNPGNPVINFRSFGENKEKVTEKALAFFRGMEKSKIISTAKHFPGHGDTQVDSHHDLPVILSSKEQLSSFELYPFRQMIQAGIPGIMTAHIHVPALDNIPNFPSTLSRKTITDLLRKNLGFEGLVFTDAMDMQGVVKHFPQGEAIVLALIAGNDIIETFMDVPAAVEAIKKAMAEGRLTREWLDFKVKKILKAKSWVGLDAFKPISRENLIKDLNDFTSSLINYQLAEKSLTLVKNEGNVLPVQVRDKKIAMVSIAPSIPNHVAEMMNNFGKVHHYTWTKESLDTLDFEKWKTELNTYDYVLTGVFLQQIRPSQKYGLTEQHVKAIEFLSNMNNSVLLWMGNVYALSKINYSSYKAAVCGYQETPFVQKSIAQAIFGGLGLSGELPVTVDESLPAGKQIVLPKTNILSYNPDLQHEDYYLKLNTSIDSMMNHALVNEYFPGGVVQVIHKDKVFFQKAYGYKIYVEKEKNGFAENAEGDKQDAMDVHTSGSKVSQEKPLTNADNNLVHISNVYDLASVTKIAGSALAVMKWVEEGKLNLDSSLATYFPEWKKFTVAQSTFRDMLTHRAGLKAWIPFWKTTIDSLATLKNAVQLHPELSDLCVVKEKKPFFIFRWFGKKTRKKILFEKTVGANNPALWEQVFNYNTFIWKEGIYAKAPSDLYTIALSDSLWLRKDYPDKIQQMILESPVGTKGQYVYSDLHYYFYPALCKRLTGLSLEDYVDNMYKQMGLYSLTYNPLEKFSKNELIPTERDSFFRNTLIHGLVHDEGAVMMGGISGHAGLFGNVNDLSKLMYMFLKGGKSEGQYIVSSEIVRTFTKYQFPRENNRRGLAFDKKDLSGSVHNAPSFASENSYGHSGYTGSYVWVDPDYDLVIVFLSNRVYPTRKNNRINESKFRQNLCDEIYKVISRSD